MHKCKYCGAQLSKLDKDVCPFCGGKKPLEGAENVTEDFTKSLDSLREEDRNNLEPKSKLIFIILTVFLGVFGIHAFYLGYKRNGIIAFLITATLVAGCGSILFFTGSVPNALAFLIPYFVLEGLAILNALILISRSDLKDARGEFLR